MDGNLKINEYGDKGPSTPKVFVVKEDETYRESPIKLLSRIPNLTYDMGGGETNYYPEKNIVIVDNIPVKEFAESPGYYDIKSEKVYVEYNLNIPISLPKANKIIVSQVVYHLNNVKNFSQTVNNSLNKGGEINFWTDLEDNEKDTLFLQYMKEYGFSISNEEDRGWKSIILKK